MSLSQAGRSLLIDDLQYRGVEVICIGYYLTVNLANVGGWLSILLGHGRGIPRFVILLRIVFYA
jgi:hypothetical protein